MGCYISTECFPIEYLNRNEKRKLTCRFVREIPNPIVNPKTECCLPPPKKVDER